MTPATKFSANPGVQDLNPVTHRPLLVHEGLDCSSVTETVYAPLVKRPPTGWYVVFGIALSLLATFGVSVAWLFWEGVGIWGNKVPVGWGYPIINFVFWVGIAHAGTLISAVLLLFRQRWRTSINRTAEAMTIFAVLCALTFPTIHVGRPWLVYWMLPIPNQMEMWPQFRSPLMWDVFAVSIYGLVSLLFWYVGLIPDLATIRDRCRKPIRRVIYGALALGWRNSARHWFLHERASLLLAALATPLVISVHSVVSFDFATSQLPGWHTTILPPYFVAGAILSGLSMVITLMVICRSAFGLEGLVTQLHFDRISKLILVTGSMVGYAYVTEFFLAWYSGNQYEFFTFLNRAQGPYRAAFWSMVFCNALIPQIFWFRWARTNLVVLFVASILINVGMWLERFVIVVTSLHRDFLPSSWSDFTPTIWDLTTLMGSFGLFFTLFCLFVRFVPMVAMSEVKSVLPGSQPHVHAVEDPPATNPSSKPRLLLAEFKTAETLVRACQALCKKGYVDWDAHSPYPIHALESCLGLKRSKLPRLVLTLGLMGAGAGMLLQWWTSSVAYPLVVSGKPLFSWPAFIPITFECAILGGALGAVSGLFIGCGLPRLHDALFNSSRFERASDDRFFLSIPLDGNEFDSASKLLQAQGPSHTEEVQS